MKSTILGRSTGEVSNLPESLNRRFVLVEEQTRAKNRLQKWIAVYFPEYKGIYIHIDAKGAAGEQVCLEQ